MALSRRSQFPNISSDHIQPIATGTQHCLEIAAAFTTSLFVPYSRRVSTKIPRRGTQNGFIQSSPSQHAHQRRHPSGGSVNSRTITSDFSWRTSATTRRPEVRRHTRATAENSQSRVFASKWDHSPSWEQAIFRLREWSFSFASRNSPLDPV